VSVSAVKERLAVIQRQVSGVARAFAHAPASLPPGDLPAFLNFTAAGTPDWSALGARYGQENRLYIMRLFVAPLGQGIDGEKERLCEPFLESVRDTFAGAPGFGLDSLDSQLPWVEAVFLGDQGVSKLIHGGDEFIGIEFRAQVKTTFQRTYRKGD
jgi:hypothetical protein